MRTLAQWGSGPWVGDLPWQTFVPKHLPESPTRIQVFCALCDMNGGSGIVSWWGIIGSGGAHGRCGLEQNEALELISLNSFVNGWISATGGEAGEQYEEWIALVRAEIARVYALAEKPEGT